MLLKLLAGAVAGPLCAVALLGAAVMSGGWAGADLGGPVPTSGGAGPAADPIPPSMLDWYRAAAPTCPGLPWEVLAGIGKVETDHGRNTAVSAAGAEGPMQFMPATWAEYGVDVHGPGVPDIDDPGDAVFGAARLLCADGASSPNGLPDAIFAYNHSTQYVSAVLGWAGAYAAEYGAGQS